MEILKDAICKKSRFFRLNSPINDTYRERRPTRPEIPDHHILTSWEKDSKINYVTNKSFK